MRLTSFIQQRYGIVVLFLLLLLSASCRRAVPGYPPQMVRAVRLMEPRPDSALHLLDSLAPLVPQLPEEARMYHALLTIKAKDKLYIKATSDTLINRIVEFYEKHGNRERLVEACYLQGGAYRDLEDAPRAIAVYQRAAELGKKYASDTLNGRIYGQMASLFALQGLYDASMEATKQAYHYFSISNNKSGMAYAWRDMARIHDMQYRADSAEYYYQKAYTYMYENVSPQEACGIGSELAGFFFNHGQVDSALVWARRMQLINPDYLTSLVLAKVYHHQQKIDSALVYCQKVLSTKNRYYHRSAYRILASIAEERKDFPMAYLYATRCIQALDSISSITQSEAVKQTYSLYNYNIAERENEQLKLDAAKGEALLAQLLLFLVALLAFIGYLFYRIRRHRREYAERIQFLQTILDEHKALSESRIAENKEQIVKLNRLSTEQEYNSLEYSKLEAQARVLEVKNEQILADRHEQELRMQIFRESDIYLHFHRASQSSELTDADWKQLVEAIDTAYPYFTKRLYTLYPQLSELELNICYLVKVGIKRSRISALLNRAPSTITNSLSRLYKKIYGTKGNPQQMDDIICHL